MPTFRNHRPIFWTTLTACALALALVPGAAAHHAHAFEHGRLHVDLDHTEDGCAITVTGRHVGASEGTLRFYAAPEGPEGVQLLMEVEIEAEPEEDGDGWMFVAGPYSDFGFDEPDWVTFYFGADEEHAFGVILDYEGCRNVDLVHAYDEETLGAPDCSFMIEGAHLLSPHGYISIRARGQEEVMRMEVEPTPEEDGEGWEFLVGPVTLDEDARYNVRFVYTANDTTHDSTIADSFVLEGCGPDRAAPDDCSFAERAHARDGGDVELEWITPQAAEGTRIYRAIGDGAFEVIAELETEPVTAYTYLDETTEPGQTYRYRIVAFNDAGESSAECDVVEVTAVPLFGTPLFGALALVGAVGVYAAFGRRRS